MKPARAVIGKSLVPSLSKVENEEEKRFYHDKVYSLWRIQPRHDGSFPGCNPVSIDMTTDLSCLRKGTYSISLKSDGVRYALPDTPPSLTVP